MPKVINKTVISNESSSEDEDYIPPELCTAAAEAIAGSLPDKSKKIYQDTYQQFVKWMDVKKTKSFSEIVLLAYFKELSTKMAPASLWPKYSMLKAIISQEKNINIENYQQLRTFLKKLNVGAKPKKALTFTSDEMKKFLTTAPNDQYLDLKVVMIIGVTGACRRKELHDMKVHHVKDEKSHLIINIPDSKTHTSRTFVINNPLREVVVSYMQLRPKDAGSDFFLNYQNGKCTKQIIGVNKIGNMPQKIAAWLNLPTPNLYTGHSFRRTSASFLANAGASIEELKRHGGWRSSQVAEGYVDQSLTNKRKICNQIIEGITDETSCDTAGSSLIKKIKLNENTGENSEDGEGSSAKQPSVTIKLDNCNVQ